MQRQLSDAPARSRAAVLTGGAGLGRRCRCRRRRRQIEMRTRQAGLSASECMRALAGAARAEYIADYAGYTKFFKLGVHQDDEVMRD